VLTLVAGLVILTFVWLIFGRAFGFNRVGGTVFKALGGFGLVYALLAGPLATADSISRERREGTLGLLFLTNLRSYDVVLGKVAASSLDILLGLLAGLPLLAMPLLAGGVSLAQLGSMGLALINLLLLSLAAGAFASSLFTSGRAALGLTLAILLFLAVGLVVIGEGILQLRTNGLAVGWFYMACPSWTVMLCLSPAAVSGPTSKYWLNMAGTHALTWIFLGLACLRTARAWRGLPESKFRRWCTARVERWSRGSVTERLNRRRLGVEQNPIVWLESSSRGQEKMLAVLISVWAIFCGLKHLSSMNPPLTPWPQRDFVIVWAMYAQYIFCLWLAVQAPRRFADDKQSGALEVLLCTTLPVSQMVRGIMSALFRRFGWPLLALVGLDLFHLFLSTRGPRANWSDEELMLLCVCGVIVFLFQGYTIARVGVYQGLRTASSVRATLGLIWNLGLMPWVLCLGSILTLDLARTRFTFLPMVSADVVIVTWALAHPVIFIAFLGRASRQLNQNFRLLAATTPVSWPRRWWAKLR
jgi:ABC-type transport system involved in cytochrome c biogenesis permease component